MLGTFGEKLWDGLLLVEVKQFTTWSDAERCHNELYIGICTTKILYYEIKK